MAGNTKRGNVGGMAKKVQSAGLREISPEFMNPFARALADKILPVVERREAREGLAEMGRKDGDGESTRVENEQKERVC